MVSGVNITLGIKLAIAISLHNIPEGISIAIPYYYATRKKLKTFLLVLISGLSELLGAIICYIFLRKLINDFIIGCIFSLIAGIMINISLSELLPESFKYKNTRTSYLGFVIGIIIMILSHILV